MKCNYPALINVRLEDGNSKPVEGASVDLVLTMAEMDHGEFKSPARMTAPGVYEAKPTFYMVGKWNVEVRARKGDQSKVQKFTYEVKK